MEFKNYYSALPPRTSPREKFRKDIAEACKVEESTVRRWVSGKIIPDALKREKIAELLGIDQKDLWPSIETNEFSED